MTKKKQGELKGMPAKTQLEKDGDKLLEAWENLQHRKAELTEAKRIFMASLKKANRSSIVMMDSDGIKRKLEYKETEGVTVTKAPSDKD